MMSSKLLLPILIGMLMSACSGGSPSSSPLDTSYDFSGDVPVDAGLISTDAVSAAEEFNPDLPERPVDFNSVADLHHYLSQLAQDDTISDEIPDSSPNVAMMPGSTFNAAVDFVDYVAREMLDDLNEKIAAGEVIDSTEQACFHEFNSSLGEPLLSLRCPTQLSTLSDRINIQVATYADTESCRSSLLSGNSEGCAIAQASISLANLPFGSVIPPDSTSEIEALNNEFLSGSLIATEIRFGGGIDQMLAMEYSTMSSVEDLVCTYSLSTGHLLNTVDIDLCVNSAKRLLLDMDKLKEEGRELLN